MFLEICSLFDLMEITPEALTQLQVSENLNLSGKIEFKGVRFSYPTRKEKPVIQGIDFTIAPGQKVAVVGPSGAGKTTISALILRYYSLDEGQILFDDQSSESFPISSLRNEMALVPQDIILFGGSIAENIAYGKPGASLDEIKRAAEKANALEFIESFPEGFDTLVGERGIQLSGGQRQRVAIARAILKDPTVLILDEATSSLDSESERLVQDALEKLMQGRTSLIIAHRLSTIRKADNILVLDQGRVKEQGTHDQLMKIENGTYRNLTDLQLLDAS